MRNQNNSSLYVIETTNLFGLPNEEPMYLAWQNPAWDDAGYFWTREETFFDVLEKNPEYNAWPHKFAFETEDSARDFAERMTFTCRYEIKKISPRNQDKI